MEQDSEHEHGGHDHGHGHGHHGHSHAPTNFGWTFAIATALNVGLVTLQVIYGLLAHSMALLADAGHNFGDALGLVLAWGAHVLARWQPTKRYTYGFRSLTILASLLNAIILLVATGAIAVEAVQRFLNPEAVAGATVMVVAGAAIILNGAAAWMLSKGQKGDLNIRGAFLHMVADTGVSLGVVVAGAIIFLTGWLRVDPAVSLVISGVIVWSTWGLLRDSMTMTLQAVPPGTDLPSVQAFLEALPGVASVHDLHIWAMSTTETALTAHLVMPQDSPETGFVLHVSEELHHRFGIKHPTLQVETGDHDCRLEPDHVV